MTVVRMFDRQVRPVRVHLPVDRHVFLCGYIQRLPDPAPDLAATPLCGPCFVAFHLLHQRLNDAIAESGPPDLDLATSVALLRETEWGPRTAHLDLDGWVLDCAASWTAMWQRP